MNQDVDADVIVVGGGFAGAIAARDLDEQGKKVILLEARDHCGGRAWSRRFGDSDVMVEVGGGYFDPHSAPNVAAELTRYGMSFVPTVSPERYVWDLDGEVFGGFPVPLQEMGAFEEALFEIKKDMRRILHGLTPDLADIDVSMDDYLGRFDLGPKSKAFLQAFAELGGGESSDNISALHMISKATEEEASLWGYFSTLGFTIDGGGTSVLMDRILAGMPEVDVRLSTPVAKVTQEAEIVRVTSTTGEEFTADAVIVAIPANCWSDVEFSPAQNETQQLFAAEGHVARTQKIWFYVEGTAPTYVMGRHPEGFSAILPDREYKDGYLFVGIKICDEESDFDDPAVVEKQVQRAIPEATVLEVDSHNWNLDPYSKGVMCAHRPGRGLPFMSEAASAPAGRIGFAGSDISGRLAGVNGAISTGHRAAEWASGVCGPASHV